MTVVHTSFPSIPPGKTGIVDSSDASSVHTTPSLRARSHHHTLPAKIDVDSHFQLDSAPPSTSSAPVGPPEQQQQQQQQQQPASASTESPPPFSSHNFPSRYFPEPSPADPYRALVTSCGASDSLTAFAPSGPAPPFEEASASPLASAVASTVVAETKAALPRDTKDSKDLDDGEPPPPYTEGSSPLEGFTYVMAAAGGAASVITQVQQGGPVAPINTALGCELNTVTAKVIF